MHTWTSLTGMPPPDFQHAIDNTSVVDAIDDIEDIRHTVPPGPVVEAIDDIIRRGTEARERIKQAASIDRPESPRALISKELRQRAYERARRAEERDRLAEEQHEEDVLRGAASAIADLHESVNHFSRVLGMCTLQQVSPKNLQFPVNRPVCMCLAYTDRTGK
jgi:hypothetical protein